MSRNYLRLPTASKRRLRMQHFSQGVDGNLDQSVLPANVASELYNFDFSSGALTTGYGLKEAGEVQRRVSNIWVYLRHNFSSDITEEILMYSDTNGLVYYKENGSERLLEGVKFSSKPYAVNYRLFGDDVILMASKTDHMVVWDRVSPPFTVENSPLITSMAIHFERMFSSVSDGGRNAVWFSRDLDPTNWDLELNRGGFIELMDDRGKVNRVLSFLNHIYIIRDWGISRLSASGAQEDFAVSNLFVSSSKIYASTATICGDRIVFLASDGLYSFDGASTRRILTRLDNLFRPSSCATACYFNGRLYLSLNLAKREETEGQDGENNAVIVLDVQSGRFSIMRGETISSFAPAITRLYAVLKDGTAAVVEKCGSIFGVPTNKRWQSGELDFGTEQLKSIQEIYFSTDTEFNLTVQTENSERKFPVIPTEGLARVRVKLSGRKIKLTIETSCEEVRISRPTVVFE